MSLVNRHTDDTLALYLREIGRVPRLSREEETELARQARQGDAAARNRLIRSHLRFVVLVARRFQGNGLPLEDLINEGNLGLIRAAEMFDPERGCPFTSYAVLWIRQAVNRAVRRYAREARPPRSMAGWTTVSLDAPVGEEEDSGRLVDSIADQKGRRPDELALDSSLREEIGDLLAALPPREAGILQARFGLQGGKPATLEEVGERYELTKERVRQIEKKSLRRIRHFVESGRLKGYLN